MLWASLYASAGAMIFAAPNQTGGVLLVSVPRCSA